MLEMAFLNALFAPVFPRIFSDEKASWARSIHWLSGRFADIPLSQYLLSFSSPIHQWYKGRSHGFENAKSSSEVRRARLTSSNGFSIQYSFFHVFPYRKILFKIDTMIRSCMVTPRLQFHENVVIRLMYWKATTACSQCSTIWAV